MNEPCQMDEPQLPWGKWASDKLMKVRPWVNLDKLDRQISQTQQHIEVDQAQLP
jgi:hypothetical protein